MQCHRIPLFKLSFTISGIEYRDCFIRYTDQQVIQLIMEQRILFFSKNL